MAQKISYSELVSIVLKEINRFRSNPQSIIPILQKRKLQYQQKIYLYGGTNNIKVTTQQGVVPVQQAIKVVSQSNRLPIFAWSYELHCAANKRAHYLARSENQQQNGINLSTLDDILPENYQFSGEVSEHFVYGYCDPLDILTNLLIDDGHPLRQNRLSLLNRELNHIGIGIEHHPKYMFVVVLIMVSRAQKKQKNALNSPSLPHRLQNPGQPKQQRLDDGIMMNQNITKKTTHISSRQQEVTFERTATDQRCRSCNIY